MSEERVDPPGPAERDPYGTGRHDRGGTVRARSGIGREVAFGPGVLVAAVAVLVLLLAALLPWVVVEGKTTEVASSGWDVVRGSSSGSVLPRLFATFALLFGGVGTALAIASRRWVVVFATAAGCAVTVVTGLWAVWSQNTEARQGPGVGLVLALVAMVVLAFRWAGYAFSRE